MPQAAAKKVEPESPETTEEPVEEVPQTVKPVGVNRFGLLAEHANLWRVNCHVDTKPEDVLQPEFWEHISRHLNRGDSIQVMPDDMSWKMVLHVHDRGHNWANVKREEFYEYGGASEPQEDIPANYKVRFAGSTHQYQVEFNGKKLKSGFATKEIAHQYVKNHAAAVKR